MAGAAFDIQGLVDAEKKLKIPPPLERLFQDPQQPRQQDCLRHALRHKLDIALAPVFKVPSVDGKQHTLSNKEMTNLYLRRREHMLGYRATLQWAIQRAGRGDQAEVACPLWEAAACPTIAGDLSPMGSGGLSPPRAMAFWHSVSGNPQLADSFVAGLRSAVACGFTVELWAYEELNNVPRGVVVKDAVSFCSRARFDGSLAEGCPLQVLADYVRAKVL